MSHPSSFDISNAREFLHEVVIPQHEDFIAKNSSKRHALLTTIVAYHIYEWAHGASTFNIDHFKSQYPSQQELADVFDLARNITNGTKHFIPNAKTRSQTGFSSAFSDGFARPLVVEFPDGTETSADILLRRMVTFWKDQEANGAF